MSKVYEFLSECYPFYLLTVKDNQPYGRPFGAVMEVDNDLYVATSNKKQVYNQLTENPNVQIIASKTGTREWLRISGIATETTDTNLKAQMLEVCPILQKHYPDAHCEYYKVFKISVSDYEFK